MQLTDRDYEHFKKVLTKDGIKYKTDQEYHEAIDNLVGYVEIAYEVAKEEVDRLHRLESEPNGFSFPGEGRCCSLCNECIIGDMWYDKKGMRCMDCQAAYMKKIIPGYVFTDKDNRRHITETRLITRYNADRKEIRKHIKDGVLKVRRVEHVRFPATLVFLKSENHNLAVFE